MKKFTLAMTVALTLIGGGTAEAYELSPSEIENFRSTLSAEEREEFDNVLEIENRYDNSVADGPLVQFENHIEDLSDVQVWSDRTRNPNPTVDDRIARLHYSESTSPTGFCTAVHVRGKFWITARHCFDYGKQIGGEIIKGELRQNMKLTQSDGEQAGVQAVYFKDANTDLALLKVGSGINSPDFTLSNSVPKIADPLTIIGFNGNHTFSSASNFDVVSLNQRYSPDGHPFQNLIAMKVKSGELGASGGDSGGAVYDPKTKSLQAIHSGRRSSGGKEEHLATPIAPNIAWINETMKGNTKASAVETARGQVGKELDNCTGSFCSGSNSGSSSPSIWERFLSFFGLR